MIQSIISNFKILNSHTISILGETNAINMDRQTVYSTFSVMQSDGNSLGEIASSSAFTWNKGIKAEFYKNVKSNSSGLTFRCRKSANVCTKNPQLNRSRY